ncbi:MAG: glycerophosphodiester phosphodiesterase [Armatimonas sp.]
MKIIAHRGASADAPENTVKAFDLAIQRGADLIETDLRLTSDGVVACLHDATLKRTFSDERALAEVSAAEAQGLGIPLLADLLALANGRIGLLLELKEDAAAAPTAALLKGTDTDQVLVQSFSVACVRSLAELLPTHTRYQLTSKAEDLTPEVLAVTAEYAHGVAAHYSIVTEENVKAMQAQGLTVVTWTVNEPAEKARLQALGIDALITDTP